MNPGFFMQQHYARNRPRNALIIHLLIILSALLLLSSPQFMPDNYSWVANTVSESAAQGIDNAWITKLGFILYGYAVVWLSVMQTNRWNRGAVIFHAGFGLCMLAVAAFSIRPWDQGLYYDDIENLLHNLFSTLMGFSISFGAVFMFLSRTKHETSFKIMDITLLLASIIIPLAMLIWTGIDGLIQRLMFFISYAWYFTESVRFFRY